MYYFANSRTFSSIKNTRTFTKQFKDTFVGKERKEKLNNLKKWINSQNENDYFLEVRGNMGVGKTRLVYEAIKECQLEDICFWFSSPEELKTDRIREFLFSQKQSKIKLFYVIDESNAKIRPILLSLAKEFSNCIKVISIFPFRDTEVEKTGDYIFYLMPMIEEDIHSIIDRYPLEKSVKDEIVKLCSGYPKPAVLLAQKIAEQSISSLNYQTCIELLKKNWIELILDEKDFKVLSALSCLIEVHREISEDNDELQCLCDVFEFDRGLANQVIDKNIEKSLVSKHSEYIYVTPLLISNYLAIKKFKHEKAKIKKLFEKLQSKYRQGSSKRPIDSLLNRYRMISKNDEELKDKYKDFLSNTSITEDVLQKKNQAEFYFNVSRK